jgi:hypothetical protein
MPNGGNSCIGNNAVASNGAATPTGMPIEACLISETCAAGGGRFGTGQALSAADRSAYVQSNYINFGAANPVGGATSRYSVYLNEITNTPASEDILPPLHDETGRNMCAATRSSDPERRVITAAAIDCSTLPPGNASDVPVLDFYRIFITNPAGFDPTAPGYSDNVSLWVEVIEHIDPFGGGSLSKGFVRDFVQLYR